MSDFDFDIYETGMTEAPIEKPQEPPSKLKDVGEQVITKGLSGLVGGYGNILDALGLQRKKGQITSGEYARYSKQFEILDKIEKGIVPSANELMMLSDEEGLDTLRLPTSEDVNKFIEEQTGIGEGKTAEGRIAGRASGFGGEGLSGGGLKTALAFLLSGGAGQGIREAGGPEALATAVEIAGPLGHSAVSGKLISSKSTKDIVEGGRKLGLSEAEITPLIQSESKAATLSKVAKKGERTKKLFGTIKEKLGDSYNRIKSLPESKVKLPNNDQITLRREFGQIRNDLSKTLAPSPEKEAALNYIEKSLDTLRNVDVTPEHLVNFWQDVNKSIKWNSIDGGKKALAKLKEPVSNILKKVNPALAEDFEITNKLYSKYSQISKRMKPDLVESLLSKAEIIGIPASGLALVQGNPWIFTGLASESAIRVLSREMLINPFFQNIAKKTATNFNKGSVKAISDSVNLVRRYMEKKHPKEDWSFLTESEDFDFD